MSTPSPIARPKGVVFVDAAAAHAAVISELHARCFDESWSAFTVRQVMCLPGAFGLLAVPAPDGRESAHGPDAGLLGFALARRTADECELLSLAVAEDHRRAGIAQALLAEVISRTRAAGARRLFLEVAEDNAAARALYERFGFEAVGRRPGYYRRKDGPAMAALTYALPLSSSDD